MSWPAAASQSALRTSAGNGSLIVNADDWGHDRETTDRTMQCILRGSVSSVSAMVFMEDSARAAGIARDRSIDAGLHLNFTDPFTAPVAPAGLADHHSRLSCYLRKHRYAQTLFHPGLAQSFRYSIAAQVEEFARLYGAPPARIDGHHHMHLCSNVVLGRLLPAGAIVRRSFSFGPGEKSFVNRWYRRGIDCALERRHRVVDYFFSLAPLEPAARLQKIFDLSRDFSVEVETHPVRPEEFQFLVEGEIFRCAGEVPVASGYTAPDRRPSR